ncbi:hypothetical protein GCM10009087_25050 [Sphingomonas oligophenolica]|uniref:MaoC/PaaZ C-terminal domain-containing protein n=1 Tax=Sphingomonas oligophenolica TaxID=301154 RepID=A0ABU9Y9N5_9SPHN
MSDAIASRHFTEADQQAFAALSGDRNPLHMDAVAARRTQIGAIAVHGMHTISWALDQLAQRPDVRARGVGSLQVRFLSAIRLGDRVELHPGRSTDQAQTFQVRVDQANVAMIKLTPGASNGEAGVPDESGTIESLTLFERDPETLEGRRGRVPPVARLESFARAFPNAAAWLGADRLRGFAALSALVGMECPGLHSIFWSLDIALDEDRAEPGIAYEATGYDERFRMVRMAVRGSGLTGQVEAVSRMPPIEQSSIADLRKIVADGAFAGQRALVIGGSRGLGELTAKMLAAGGAEICLTYFMGDGDAERVVGAIEAAGGSGAALRYDAGLPAAAQLDALPFEPTHLYYFATRQIAGRRQAMFEPARFESFTDVYVRGFHDICEALLARGAGPLVAFYPSSVFVETKEGDFVEYAMAKAAGEILAACMANTLARLSVIVERLPRLPTDQTGSIRALEMASPNAVMLPILIAAQARFLAAAAK